MTTQANESMAPYHFRMPILLRAHEVDDWLSGKNRDIILNRKPFELLAERVQPEASA